MRFFPAVSASWPCFSATASLPKTSRRQPDKARTGALSSAAIASRSSAEDYRLALDCFAVLAGLSVVAALTARPPHGTPQKARAGL
jgi:hypothetical protein